MKLGIIITQSDPETVFNILRLAAYSLEQGDEVRIFLSGRGVEMDRIENSKFDAVRQAQLVLDKGGRFFTCGSCLRIRNTEGTETRPLSTLKDQYEIVRDSDRLVTI